MDLVSSGDQRSKTKIFDPNPRRNLQVGCGPSLSGCPRVEGRDLNWVHEPKFWPRSGLAVKLDQIVTRWRNGLGQDRDEGGCGGRGIGG